MSLCAPSRAGLLRGPLRPSPFQLIAQASGGLAGDGVTHLFIVGERRIALRPMGWSLRHPLPQIHTHIAAVRLLQLP
jgi:hypothetical protein